MIEEEKKRALPIMLKGDDFSLFFNTGNTAATYREAKQLLEGCYNSEERRSGIMSEWHKMALTAAMLANPEEYETKVFSSFIAVS